MCSYFFFLQDKKRRRCRASSRLFNEVEWENNKQKNVTLLLNHSLTTSINKNTSIYFHTIKLFSFICIMIIFYSLNISNQQAKLTEDEAIHCSKVLRKKVEDEVYVTDGFGKLYKGVITQISKKEVLVELTEELESQPKPHIRSVAIAPTKNIDRFEWFLEKSTEIGITNIFPFLSSRSERKIIKPQRLEKILVSAMKQSKNLNKPTLHPLIPLSQLLKTDYKQSKYIAHCMEPEFALQKLYKRNTDAIVLIGPEGDFTSEEVDLASVNHWTEVSLGNSRLRTETAGIVACHLLNL